MVFQQPNYDFRFLKYILHKHWTFSCEIYKPEIIYTDFNLKKIVIVMKLDLSKIKFSNNDIRNNVQIQNILTPKLAEFIGIVVGDGPVGVYKNCPGKRTFSNYEIRISGNLKDYDYYSIYINDLA